VTTAQRLAVGGDHALARAGGLVPDPLQEGRLEGRGVEGGEDPAEGVGRGDAVGQHQETAQPGLLAAAEQLDVDPGIGPAQHRADRDDDHVEQAVAQRGAGAGVGEVDETAGNGRQGKRVHAGTPGGGQSKRRRQYPRPLPLRQRHAQMR
jgi:hypothetical protein